MITIIIKIVISIISVINIIMVIMIMMMITVMNEQFYVANIVRFKNKMGMSKCGL